MWPPDAIFQPKMHKNVFATRVCPGPYWGAYSTVPNLIAGLTEGRTRPRKVELNTLCKSLAPGLRCRLMSVKYRYYIQDSGPQSEFRLFMNLSRIDRFSKFVCWENFYICWRWCSGLEWDSSFLDLNPCDLDRLDSDSVLCDLEVAAPYWSLYFK